MEGSPRNSPNSQKSTTPFGKRDRRARRKRFLKNKKNMAEEIGLQNVKKLRHDDYLVVKSILRRVNENEHLLFQVSATKKETKSDSMENPGCSSTFSVVKVVVPLLVKAVIAYTFGFVKCIRHMTYNGVKDQVKETSLFRKLPICQCPPVDSQGQDVEIVANVADAGLDIERLEIHEQEQVVGSENDESTMKGIYTSVHGEEQQGESQINSEVGKASTSSSPCFPGKQFMDKGIPQNVNVCPNTGNSRRLLHVHLPESLSYSDPTEQHRKEEKPTKRKGFRRHIIAQFKNFVQHHTIEMDIYDSSTGARVYTEK